jgi:ABC-2 type transport system permease protein
MKHILSKRNKTILSEMVRSDFKLRYQNSVLGYLWSLLRPLLLSLFLYVVFVKFLAISGKVPHYASYLLLGIMVWTFFIEVTSNGVGAVVGKGDLIRKITIPRYLTVVSTSVSALINFGLNFVVLAGIMLISGVEIQAKLIIFVPLLLIELYVLSISLAFILSAAFVKFRDLSFIWEVFTQLLFYATPIIYPMSLVLEKYAIGKYILLNPLAQIIQDMRHILVTQQAQTAWELLHSFAYIPLAFTVIIAIVAVRYFSKESKSFAENV